MSVFETHSTLLTVLFAVSDGSSVEMCSTPTVYDNSFSATRVAYLAVELQKQMTPSCYATVTASEYGKR